MARKKVKALDLSSAVDEMLKVYGDDVFSIIGTAIKETCEDAVKELKAVKTFAPDGIATGAYSSDWVFEEIPAKRYTKRSVVHNEEHYRLSHLLEYGHAKQNGGRTRAFPHIAPVNDNMQANIIKKVEEGIQRV